MSQNLTSTPEELERRQLTEFRSTHPVRARLPASFWVAAADSARRYGVHRTARVLHLDYVGLKKRVQGQKRPKPQRPPTPPTFVELVAPTATVSLCRIEVEAAPGQLRLELPALAPTELAHLLRAFRGR